MTQISPKAPATSLGTLVMSDVFFSPQPSVLPSNTSLLVAAGLLHLTQPLVMAFAEKTMDGWRTEGELARIAQLARRVIQATLRGAVLGLALVVIAHFEEALELGLGRCLMAMWATLVIWMLVARRRASTDAAAFRRERLQILFVVSGLGVVMIANAKEAATTSLGLSVVSGLWILFSVRAFLEVFVYGPLYRRRIMKLWNVAGGLLFVVQSTLYGLVRVRVPVESSPMIPGTWRSFGVNKVQETRIGKACNNARVNRLLVQCVKGQCET